MNLLIELLCEEIPARMQHEAEEKGTALLADLLKSFNLISASHNDYGCWVSPRRIALWAKDIRAHIPAQTEERRGPKTTAPKQALDGFLKTTGLKQEHLRIAGDYYYADISKPAQTAADLIPEVLQAFLNQMPWPKTMRWHGASRQWVRPIRGVVCMLDDKHIEFDVEGLDLQTSSHTFGHRFLSSNSITLKGYTAYEQQLENAYVIPAFTKRRHLILTLLEQKAEQKGLRLVQDDTLLNEVTGLVDYPFVQIGTIADAFTNLPPEVLITSMRVHQKYFALQKIDGSIAPFFAVVTNVPDQQDKLEQVTNSDKRSLMMAGYERVLSARLADAQFFYMTDVKAPLEALVPKYDQVIFHEKLGSLGEKVQRLLHVITALDQHTSLTPDEVQHLKRAALICKADLFTSMVGEFPELQGTMGRIYALAQGEHPCIADALEQHYQPLGPNRPVPQHKMSRLLACIDKVDTLVGFIGHGIKPTATKDPLAIRRTALGIIRLCETGAEQSVHDLTLLLTLIDLSIAAYKLNNRPLLQDVKQEVLTFIDTRLKVYRSN